MSTSNVPDEDLAKIPKKDEALFAFGVRRANEAKPHLKFWTLLFTVSITQSLVRFSS